MRTDTFYCYCISKRMTKKACKIAESQNHECVSRARLTACEVGIFLRNISQLLKVHPPSLFEDPLKFISYGRIFERLW